MNVCNDMPCSPIFAYGCSLMDPSPSLGANVITVVIMMSLRGMANETICRALHSSKREQIYFHSSLRHSRVPGENSFREVKTIVEQVAAVTTAIMDIIFWNFVTF